MNRKSQWIDYDPYWLILLAQEQHPEEEWLPQALAACTRAIVKSQAYIQFAASSQPNDPELPSQVARNILLHSPTEGLVALDIGENQRVSGIEFYKRLLKGPGITCPCGFVHNYTDPSNHSWLTIQQDASRETLQALLLRSEPAIEAKKREARVCGYIYECPKCGRIIWRKPGEKSYSVFLPEGEV